MAGVAIITMVGTIVITIVVAGGIMVGVIAAGVGNAKQARSYQTK